MVLIPTCNAKINSKLSKEEVILRLKKDIADKYDHKSGKSYVGTIESSGFEFSHILLSRIGNPIKISGKFSSQIQGTEVDLNIKNIDLFLISFSTIWVLGNIGLFSGWFGIQVGYENINHVIGWIILFPAIFYVKKLISFNVQSKFILNHLKNLWDGDVIN